MAWKSNHKKKVSQSSCESKIHATDECCKLTQGLHLIMNDLELFDVNSPTEVYNDNHRCVDWTKRLANCKMRLMNIREMACHKVQLDGKINVNHHIEGKLNPSDLLNKEHKTGETFIQLCNFLVMFHPAHRWGALESGILKSGQRGKKDMPYLTFLIAKVCLLPHNRYPKI